MGTAIQCDNEVSVNVDLTFPTDIRQLGIYVRHDLYIPQSAFDSWVVEQFGPGITFLNLPGASNNPFMYPWTDDPDGIWDTWVDGWTAPDLDCCFSGGWHVFEWFMAGNGGTNRFAVDGNEVTWPSVTDSLLRDFTVGNDGTPSVTNEPIWIGMIAIGSDWQLHDLFEFDGTAVDQETLQAERDDGRFGWFTFGDVPFISETPEAPAPPSVGTRFEESPPWRFAVTGLGSGVLTLLDKRAKDRTVTKILNAPAVMECTVASDDPEVNIVAGDGYPFVHEGVRLLYCFRRDALNDAQVWVIRAAGIILDVDDEGNPDIPRTRVVAYDPWQLLYRRPILTGGFELPEQDGLRFDATPGSEIALALIERTISEHGMVHLDLGAGTVETTEDLTIDFQHGLSVGEALDQLVATGTMDIVITPVWDPVDRPGIVGDLNIYTRAGSVLYDHPFAWDRPTKNVVQLNRKREGRERVNRAQYYVGQGGPPVPEESNAGSIAIYGEYWEQQFFPAHQQSAAVQALADAQVRLRSDGLVTYTMSPAPERAPRPLRDYDIGDIVPIYASQRLREETATMRRIHAIPLVINDSQYEAPASILMVEEEGIGS